MGANLKFLDLGDVTRRKSNLAVECSSDCGNQSIVDAQRLSRYFLCHGWSGGLAQVSQHLRCSQCFGRPIRIRVTAQMPNGPFFGPRTEGEWVALVKRLRNF